MGERAKLGAVSLCLIGLFCLLGSWGLIEAISVFIVLLFAMKEHRTLTELHIGPFIIDYRGDIILILWLSPEHFLAVFIILFGASADHLGLFLLDGLQLPTLLSGLLLWELEILAT